MVPSIIDVWGYDREFCSSSSFVLGVLYSEALLGSTLKMCF